jgi:hypothetical protein
MDTTQHPNKLTEQSALNILKEMFLRNGYVRVKNEKKHEAFGSKRYKKGYEIRFLPMDKAELELLQTAISSLNLHVSKTFIKHGRIVQPLYGKENVLKFHNLQPKPKTKRRSFKKPFAEKGNDAVN